MSRLLVLCLAAFLIVESASALKCYSCNSQLGEECGSNSNVMDCDKIGGQVMEAMAKNAKKLCLSFSATVQNKQVVSKTCTLDLSSLGLDVCGMAKSVVSAAGDEVKNVNCVTCDTDKCNL